MRTVKIRDQEAAILLTRKEALQLVHDLTNQLADADVSGSAQYWVTAVPPGEHKILDARAVVFMLCAESDADIWSPK